MAGRKPKKIKKKAKIVFENIADLNKQGFFSLRELAQKYGYAKDHISRLARENKIQAIQFSNRGEWYASQASVIKHQKKSEKRFPSSTTKQKTVLSSVPFLPSRALRKGRATSSFSSLGRVKKFKKVPLIGQKYKYNLLRKIATPRSFLIAGGFFFLFLIFSSVKIKPISLSDDSSSAIISFS